MLGASIARAKGSCDVRAVFADAIRAVVEYLGDASGCATGLLCLSRLKGPDEAATIL